MHRRGTEQDDVTPQMGDGGPRQLWIGRITPGESEYTIPAAIGRPLYAVPRSPTANAYCQVPYPCTSSTSSWPPPYFTLARTPR
jgi:hypothetical protein